MKTIFRAIRSFTGLGSEIPAFKRLSRFIASPVNYLENPGDKTSDLLDILTLLHRVLFIWKLIEGFTSGFKYFQIFFPFLVAGVIFSRQFSWLLLWLNSRVLNSFFRLIFRSDNLLAAKRAYTYSFILPGTYYLLFIAKFIGIANITSRLGLALTLLLLVVGYMAEVAIVKKLYEVKFWQALCCSGFSFIFIYFLTLITVVPGFLGIVRIAATEVVTENLNHELLNFRDVHIDTSQDGSSSMIEILNEGLPIDTAGMFKHLKKNSLPAAFSEKQYSGVLESFDGLFKATYFKKEAFEKALPENSTHNDSSEIDIKYPIAFKYWMLVPLYLARYQFQNKNFDDGIQNYEKGLQICKITAQSSLSLVSTVTAVVFMDLMNKDLGKAVDKIDDVVLIERLQRIMIKNAIEPNWMVNILNTQHRANFTVYNSMTLDAFLIMKLPGTKLIFDLLFDIHDTKAIHDQIGIRIMMMAENAAYDELHKSHIPEFDLMIKCADNIYSRVFWKNPIGRILLIVTTQVFTHYVRDSEANRRYGELVLHALAIRKYVINNDTYPESLIDIYTSDSLMKKADFLYNETLIWYKAKRKLSNTDSIRFKNPINYEFE